VVQPNGAKGGALVRERYPTGCRAQTDSPAVELPYNPPPRTSSSRRRATEAPTSRRRQASTPVHGEHGPAASRRSSPRQLRKCGMVVALQGRGPSPKRRRARGHQRLGPTATTTREGRPHRDRSGSQVQAAEGPRCRRGPATPLLPVQEAWSSSSTTWVESAANHRAAAFQQPRSRL